MYIWQEKNIYVRVRVRVRVRVCVSVCVYMWITFSNKTYQLDEEVPVRENIKCNSSVSPNSIMAYHWL